MSAAAPPIGPLAGPSGALVNIDVPSIAAGRAFYEQGLGFVYRRLLFDGLAAELEGAGLRLFLIAAPDGSEAVRGGALRSYRRHWTPVHLDLLVEDVPRAAARAEAAGARLERPIVRNELYELAPMADPFGNGFCLLCFMGSDYDSVAAP